MDKEKEIEELKTKLDNFCLDIDNECEIGCSKCLANFLINAGYGNIEQAVRAFAEELKKNFLKHFPTLFTDAIYQFTDSQLDDLIKERFGK